MDKITRGLFVGVVRKLKADRKPGFYPSQTKRIQDRLPRFWIADDQRCMVLQPQLEEHPLAVEIWNKVTREQLDSREG